jgi:16S rRNA (guanine527-N7)-methyltransferase
MVFHVKPCSVVVVENIVRNLPGPTSSPHSVRLPSRKDPFTVDNSPAHLLAQGLDALALTVSCEDQSRLLAWMDELLKWNTKVSLTAITKPHEVVDKHLLDSLAVMPEVQSATHVLDLGAGAGLPGLPLVVVHPTLRATLVDAVEKKVAFMKAAAVKAGIATRVKAIHARAAGHPQQEGLPTVDLVISRAFMDVGPFLALARHYLLPQGRVVVMLGKAPNPAVLTTLAAEAGLSFVGSRTFTLPLSKDPRAVAVFQRST